MALHFLAASFNTAIFSSTTVLTLLLSAVCLPRLPNTDLIRSLFSRTTLAVTFAVAGVALISEPWRSGSSDKTINLLALNALHFKESDRLLVGVGFSLLAGAGT